MATVVVMMKTFRLLFALSVLASGVATGADDPLARLELEATTGAAPGYVADQSCARCHPREYDSFQHVGMAQSMRRPTQDVLIEDFDDNHHFHKPSQRHYEMHWDGESLRFERYQVTDDGKRINTFETRVDWILGSGNRTRSYLFATPGGELYQLPIDWYTQDQSWGMSPGFESADHPGVTRQVRRECLFCHNAYPEVPAGSDGHWQPHVFPDELPEGIGCQRCHGPGAEHIRTVLRGQPAEAVREAIVNPARLSPARRDEVCYQCHLQPAVAMIGVRRFDRGDFSFRPGQALSDYMLHVDIDTADPPAGGRFEINHHAYRLRQSRCFRESDKSLSCLTCHDPHRKAARPEARDHYRDACLGCHRRHNELPADGRLTDDGEDCVACHMPQRRTSDVINVTMTDHRIAAGPFDADALTAPMAKTTPVIEDVHFYFPDQSPDGPLGEIYRAVTVLRVGPDKEAINHLANQLGRVSLNTPVPFLDLAKAQLAIKAYDRARETLKWLLERRPGAPRIHDWLGVAYMATDRPEAAREHLHKALERDPDKPEVLQNLALVEIRLDNPAQALVLLERALAQRPNMATAWYHRGRLLYRMDRPEAAKGALRRALGVDPTHTRAYAELTRVLRALGDGEQASRVLRHGRSHTAEPELLEPLINDAASSGNR